ncbi:hypothetical protein PHYBOEH_004728 [Phytophthora boehmeriae]|uniref:Cytidyltransferase-like domain-containing protein n=1 Tax=Phytophthora boehmeriae TaxID=109152 RepID=A0A8T1X4W3_9STRA|nr:hypothetical protein PHYBOEH_004728 [Phytophthora boehmeriae]
MEKKLALPKLPPGIVGAPVLSGASTALAVVAGVVAVVGASALHKRVAARSVDGRKKPGLSVRVGLLRMHVPQNFRDLVKNDVLLEKSVEFVSHTLFIFVSGRDKHEVVNYISELYGVVWDVACTLEKPFLDIRIVGAGVSRDSRAWEDMVLEPELNAVFGEDELVDVQRLNAQRFEQDGLFAVTYHPLAMHIQRRLAADVNYFENEHADLTPHDLVVLGGTFDHLHNGHKKLLSLAVSICANRILIGVTADSMLTKKSNAELLEPLGQRKRAVRAYLSFLNPHLNVDIVTIEDPFGPAIDNSVMEREPTFMENVMRTKPLSVIHAEEVAEELPRHLSLFDLLCIGIGSTVGSGVFSTSGEIISTTAGPAAFVSWIIAGLVCCINALAYMELVTRIPSSGSTYAYAYHAMGELPAVMAAWLLTLEYGVSGSGVARSWATKVQEWLVEEHPEHTYQWLNEDYTNLLGALMMALCVAVLLVGIRFGKWFVNTITTIKVFVVLFIIVVGFTFMNSDNLSPFVPERQEVDGSMTFGAQGIITGASSAFFGYTGFDEVCCLAAEAKNPKKIMPLAVIGVVTGTMFLSAFASLALSGMIPYLQAESFGSGFDYQNANWAAQIVRAGETCTMPVVVLVCFLAQPRLNYALSCDGLMPRIFSKVDDKGNLFENTLITGTFFTAVAFVVPFETLWDIVSFGVLLSFNMSMASLLVMRMRKESPVLAPKLIGLMVLSAGLAAFFYQIGYSNEGHVWCLILGLIFLVVTIITCFVMYFKCPQELSNPDNFAAPLVPFLPTFAVLANFYLAAQISYTGIYTSFAWLAASVVFYFSYGYKHSAGRTGWSALMSLPRESSLNSPMLSSKNKKQQLQE